MSSRFLFFVLILIASALGRSAAWAQGLEPVLPLPEYAPSAPEALPTLTFHGGLYMQYYRPQQSWADEEFSINYLYLVLDSTYDDFGLRFEGRFAEWPPMDYYPSNFWIQESYLYYRQPNYIFKVGKSYSRFGHFWDGSIYGNVLAFDGLVLSPDDGFSFEGKTPERHGFFMNYYLQYYINDGDTNASLDGQRSGAPTELPAGCEQPPNFDPCYDRTGRDTITINGARRRNEIIGRIEPNWRVGGGTLTVGASYMFLLADMTTLPPPPNAPNIVPGRYNVHRYAYDIAYDHGPFSIFFELAHQRGQTVLDYPDTGEPSQNIFYYWTGVSYKTGRWTWYYNYSEGVYKPYNLHNIVEVPGFAYDVRKYLQFIFEYGYMGRQQTGSFYLNDNSLNFYLKASI